MFKSWAWEALATAEARTGVSRLLPNRSNAILMYHSVGRPGAYGDISRERFEADLRFLTERYEVVDLPEVLDAPDRGRKRVAITFDDCLEGVYTDALPVIREADVPATVFVVADGMDGTVAGLSSTLDADQLEGLRSDHRIAIGNHTRTHPNLSAVSGDRLRDEIVGARRALEDRLGVPVDRFCYPSGDVSEEALSVVRSSHDIAVTTRQRLISSGDCRHLLPRITGHRSAARVRWELTDASDALRRVAAGAGLVDAHEEPTMPAGIDGSKS